jgi:hypothetical protein
LTQPDAVRRNPVRNGRRHDVDDLDWPFTNGSLAVIDDLGNNGVKVGRAEIEHDSARIDTNRVEEVVGNASKTLQLLGQRTCKRRSPGRQVF